MDTTDRMDEARAVLKKHWGYDDFRPAQQEILPEILAGEDVLAIMPTGGGKSALFQVPALLDRGSTIVISPLIALMKDQVDDCIRRGISASYVNSSIDADEAERRFEEWVEGQYRLFYIAPERISVKSFQRALQRADVARIAVDEAHCAAQWGHDFRPAYARIHEIVASIERYTERRPTILAVTATATWEIEEQMAQAIGLRDGYTRYVADPLRPNLSYEVIDTSSSWQAFRRCIGDIKHASGRHIVYAGTRKGAQTLSETVESEIGWKVGVYHAGIDQDPRKDVQEQFKDGRLPLVVATSAFGMGIDVPDIRTVIHFGIPDSLESYTQQAGRAGRDGKPSRCILIVDEKALELQQFFLDNQNPPYKSFELVWNWLHTQLHDELATIRLSAREIAEQIERTTRERISDSQVSTVLNGLEAHALVERQYAAEATPVTVTVARLRERLRDAKRESTKMVIEELARTLQLQPSESRTTVAGFVNKQAIATRVKLSTTVIQSVLKQLHEARAIDLGETFVGKTTRLKKYRAKLGEHLPGDQIQHKRDRALTRLRAMIDYSCTRSAKDRHELVRNYFLGDGM